LAILTYSQTLAFSWDTGYHLLAAQLIAAGRKPYIDFCFPQGPVNAYWNALWMRLLGESWRIPQAMAALFTTGAIWLMADFVRRRFPAPEWQTGAAISTIVVAGGTVFLWGGVAQPYGLCLFAVAAGFRLTISAAGRDSVRRALAAGWFAGAAAASSMLTAMAVPVLAGYLLLRPDKHGRWKGIAAFAAGAALAWAPVFRLFALGPRQTWFNLIEYHARFRSVYWPETTRHDLEVLTSWIQSAPATIVGGLAIYGLWFTVRASQWTREWKSQFYLCAWLAAALGATAAAAHPTFPRYFILMMPFAGVLAAAGLYALRPAAPGAARIAVLTVVMLAGLARSLYDRRAVDPWSVYERLARKVDEVTPAGAPLLADEPIYFLTKRTPPRGFELYYTHELQLPAADRKLLHILTQAEVRQMARDGFFATVYSCDTDEAEDYNLNGLYQKKVDMGECSIYWERKATSR
jgi:4-amino-4-deoxy-L-arabinose transferase-like glycosyltransferase